MRVERLTFVKKYGIIYIEDKESGYSSNLI